MPTIVTLHHPITKDRALEMAHAENWRSGYSIGRWYNFVKMQGRVASRMPRIVVVSENSIKDIHADMGVSLDRMRLVPVGVDPESVHAAAADVARKPGRLITTASADVALKGLSYLLEAMAKLRTERDVTLTIIGKPRDGASNDLIDQLGLRPHIEFVSAACPTSASSSSTPRPRWPSCRASTRVSACRPSRRCRTGICLVATDGGALPEVTGDDGETVLQCQAGDVDALAAAIRRGLDDAELRARDRCGRSSTRRRTMELEALRRADRRPVPRGARHAAQRRQAAPERAAVVADDPLRPTRRAARRPRARRRRRLRPPRLRAAPVAAPTSSPSTTPPTRSPAPEPRSAAMAEAGEIADERFVGGLRATPRGCRSPTAPSTASSPARCSNTSRTTSPRSPSSPGC